MANSETATAPKTVKLEP